MRIEAINSVTRGAKHPYEADNARHDGQPCLAFAVTKAREIPHHYSLLLAWRRSLEKKSGQQSLMDGEIERASWSELRMQVVHLKSVVTCVVICGMCVDMWWRI